MTDNVRCVLVKIHGIGQQPQDWSKDFDDALAAALTPGELAVLAQQSVWWAPLSRLPGTPTRALPGAGVAPGSTATTATNQAFVEYSRHLARSMATTGPRSTLPSGARSFDLGSVIGGLTGQLITLGTQQISMADHAADVANYIGNNQIRLAIQETLSSVLLAMQADHPKATLILGSHSQGTIISYDMVRLLAGQLSSMKVWVSMGCPLGWYLDGASWGPNEMEMSAGLRWVNLYDPQDVVGQDLDRLASWSPVVPEDIDVNNVGQGLHPHDHWHNPAVVARYVELIQASL
jgi:hypothetical protein